MKKLLVFLICLFGMVLMSCYEEVNNDIEIKIVNNSSLDLHISFYPNTFTNTRVGVTYKFSDVNVRKGESVSLTVKFRYNQRIYFDIATAWIGPNPFLIQKIVFSKMETGELIKEVKRNGLIKPVSPGFLLFTLEITDEILSIQGECYEK